jgi:arginine/lysine/ornithine decarboxylase
VDLSDRLARWVTRAFPPATAYRVIQQLRELTPATIGSEDRERVQAALVVRSGGDWHRFQQMRDLALRDPQRALVTVGLDGPDWPERLAAVLDA